MTAYQEGIIEKRMQKLKADNDSLKKKLSSFRLENSALLKKVKNFDSLFNSNPSGIILIQQGKVRGINSSMEKQLGYSSDAVTGVDFLKLVPLDQRALIGDLLKKWLSGKALQDNYVITMVAESGEILQYDTRVNKVIYSGRTALILSMVESESRILAERKMVAEGKIKAGVLTASGISEEFGGYFNSLLKNVEEVRSASSEDDILARIENESRKALAIIKKLDLMTGCARDKNSNTVFDLNNVVNKAVLSSMNEWKDGAEYKGLNIDVKTYLRSSVLIEGDPLELQEAVAVIIHNAVNAMPDGGDVLLTTEDNGDYGHIYVQDDGVGISDDIIEHIFDPFFTTGGNNSLGLGLSIAFSIVKRHNGEIKVASSRNNGSVFEVRLPAANRKLIRYRNRSKKKIKDTRILLLQGEDIVKQLLAQMLLDKGCTLDQASSVLETVKLLKKRKFDLVIADTDVLTSDEKVFIKKIKKIDQDIHIVLVGGHMLDGDMASYDENSEDLRMVKPLDLNNTLRLISDLLMGRLDV